MTRVAVVVSHPIQHFCPQYSSWARLPDVDLKVFFGSRRGLDPYVDPHFGSSVQWPSLVLDFTHEFLQGPGQQAIGVSVDPPPLARRLESFDPDVLIVYGYSQRLQRHARRWAVGAKVAVLMVSDSELHSQRGLTKQLAKALVLPRIFRKAALFLTVGDANEAYYRRYGVDDRRFVRCFFPIDRLAYDAVLADKEAARARVRTRHGIPESHLVVLNVGKLIPRKRQKDLVAVSNRLRGLRQDVTMVLAGSGPDQPELQRSAGALGAGGVLFAGFVPPDVLTEYYCAADVYAHCSEHEPHSLAISEGIYCGLPILLSDRCGSYGPTDDVRFGSNGLVFRCGDTDDLFNKLSTLIEDSVLRHAMSRASARIGRAHQELAHGQALEQALRILRLPRTSVNRSV